MRCGPWSSSAPHGTAIAGPALEPTIRSLQEVILSDENAICVGFAMDALGRLAHLRPEDEAASDLQAEVSTLLEESPMRCWESLVRSGPPPQISLLPLEEFLRPLLKRTPLRCFERIPDQQLFADRLQKAAIGPTPRIIVAAEAAQIEH